MSEGRARTAWLAVLALSVCNKVAVNAWASHVRRCLYNCQREYSVEGDSRCRAIALLVLASSVAVTDAVLNAHHGKETRVYLMARAVAEPTGAGKTDQANAYLSRFVGEYPDAEMTKSTVAQFGKSRVLRVGNTVPAFRLTPVAASAVTYTPEMLKGKVSMIDFWATWCRPCVAQMPVLQKAFSDFRNRGFEILSVSADGSRETVNGFQKKWWKMPWLNAIAIDGLASLEFRQFEISFLPRAVLVDKDGKIIAADGELRGTERERTLTRVLVATLTE